jgi:archaemetzincin
MTKNLKIKLFLSFVFLAFIFSIGLFYFVFLRPTKEVNRFLGVYISTKPKTIIVQPMGNFDIKLAKYTLAELKKIYPHFILNPNCELPKAAFNPTKNRYRADSILNIYKYKYGKDTVIIAMTSKDISTTKGKIADWGIMGLGHRPGNVCVVSTYRLNKKNLINQFYKLCIHELGHTQGLPHCPVKTCYMRDAEGGNPIDEETDFCVKCKEFLKGKGWK